jgi:hypothetical protein
MTYHIFHKTVWRARKGRKPTAASSWEKQNKISEPAGLQEAEIPGRPNPLANRDYGVSYSAGARAAYLIGTRGVSSVLDKALGREETVSSLKNSALLARVSLCRRHGW